MTIFARRRIQAMLDDLAPLLDERKGKDVIERLNSKKLDQALPAEMEVALLWALNSLGDLEIEPEWWGDSKRPDGVLETLVPGRIAAIEIAAPNDNSISGEKEMDAIAVQVSALANQSEKGAGDHLYFRFGSNSGYEEGRYFRRRHAPRDYKLRADQIAAIARWITSGMSLTNQLTLTGDGLAVSVERTQRKQIRFHNIWSTMPPEAHHLEDNPFFELLVRKARQLRAAQPGTLRLLFVADVGSTLLRKLGRGGSEIDHTNRSVAARQIIQHFLEKRTKSVDAVVTFSPRKEMSPWGMQSLIDRKPRSWTVGFFGTARLPDLPPKLERIAALLPEPRYEGYQARSLFRQGAFSPDSRGQYVGMTIRGGKEVDSHSVELPARLLMDLLAGRITEERFRRCLDGREGNENIFKLWLDTGMTLSGVEMAPRNVDEDDDRLILHFTDDPAARPFKLQLTDPS